MKLYSFFPVAALLSVLWSGNASDAVRLNEHGWLFPLSSYHDWKGKTAGYSNDGKTGMAAVSCKGSPDRTGISSRKLEKDLAEVHLPDWEYSGITLPAVIAPGFSASTLQFIAGRKGRMFRGTFIMHGPDGILRTYRSRSLYTRDPSRGGLKLSELKNFYFSCRTARDAVLQFGDLQMELRGKAALTGVPVVDAAAADQIPAEKDWNAIPAAYSLKGTLKAPVSVKILHDVQCIYVCFEQKTDTSKLVSKQNRDGQIWRDDSFQILLSPGNDNRSYHQFVVNAAGASQSYHQFFDQVADCYVRKNNLREKVLTNFSCVDDALKGLEKIDIIPIAKPDKNGNYATGHWRISDKTGRSVVLEITDKGKRHIYENNLRVFTNSPSFPWHQANLNNYIHLSGGETPDKTMGQVHLFSLGGGTNLTGLPGDLTPPSRLVRAFFYAQTASTRAGWHYPN